MDLFLVVSSVIRPFKNDLSNRRVKTLLHDRNDGLRFNLQIVEKAREADREECTREAAMMLIITAATTATTAAIKAAFKAWREQGQYLECNRFKAFRRLQRIVSPVEVYVQAKMTPAKMTPEECDLQKSFTKTNGMILTKSSEICLHGDVSSCPRLEGRGFCKYTHKKVPEIVPGPVTDLFWLVVQCRYDFYNTTNPRQNDTAEMDPPLEFKEIVADKAYELAPGSVFYQEDGKKEMVPVSQIKFLKQSWEARLPNKPVIQNNCEYRYQMLGAHGAVVFEDNAIVAPDRKTAKKCYLCTCEKPGDQQQHNRSCR